MPTYYIGTDGSANNSDSTAAAGGVCIRRMENRKLTTDEINECKNQLDIVEKGVKDMNMYNLMKVLFEQQDYEGAHRFIREMIETTNNDMIQYMNNKVYKGASSVKQLKFQDILNSGMNLRKINKLFNTLGVNPSYSCYHFKLPFHEIKDFSIEKMEVRDGFEIIHLNNILDELITVKGTNNRGELMAIIMAIYLLDYLKMEVGAVNIITDSELCLKHLTGIYKRKCNLDLFKIWERLYEQRLKEGWVITLVWQKAHLADRASTKRIVTELTGVDFIKFQVNSLADKYADYRIK